VLGDDLALNAEQVSGVRPERELPVVWAVAKGSARNKLVLVPAALAVSAFAPWAVVPLLMAGGLYLCYEGFEKLAHKLLHSRAEDDARRAGVVEALVNPQIDLVAFERTKIRGAVRTDFILSAEIIVITLGTVAAAPLPTRVAVLASIAAIMTVGVYGLVAGIVKLDDAGLYLMGRRGTGARESVLRAAGRAIVAAAPWMMKSLSVAGTAAMFLVGGGILTHGIPVLHRWVEGLAHGAQASGFDALLEAVTPMLIDAVTGIVAGAITLLVVNLAQRALRAAKGG
jgi:predicted DNA repair protein MutK